MHTRETIRYEINSIKTRILVFGRRFHRVLPVLTGRFCDFIVLLRIKRKINKIIKLLFAINYISIKHLY